MTRICLFLVLGFAAPFAQASFDFSPIISSLAPSGAAASTSFTVVNQGDTKIPVQVTIVAREPDEDGKEIYKESDAVDEMFRVFPAQVVLNPKESRTIRVSYIGSPKIKAEISFRIIAEELPVDVNDPKKIYTKAVAQVTIATKYVGSLYVTPSGVKPDVLLDARPDAKNPKILNLTITNKGTAHQVVRKPVVKLQPLAGGDEVVLEGAEVKTLVNLNILPGKTRKFTLDWPKNLPVGPVKASIALPKE